MNNPDESMWCSWGEHYTEEYITYWSQNEGICSDCIEKLMEEEEDVIKRKALEYPAGIKSAEGSI